MTEDASDVPGPRGSKNRLHSIKGRLGQQCNKRSSSLANSTVRSKVGVLHLFCDFRDAGLGEYPFQTSGYIKQITVIQE